MELKDLLKGVTFSEQPADVRSNLMTLLERASKLLQAYMAASGLKATPVVTSGLRTKADQLRIYKAKGVPEASIPWGSQHLKGAAVDIADADGKLKSWILKNEDLAASLGLWFEDFGVTKTWVHMQIYPPKSGARFFKP